jgi:glutamine amidotransferase
MIAVIDYGAGNLRNVCKALEHVGARPELTSDAGELTRADKLVLPGVGAFADCLRGLQSRGLAEPLRQLALDGKPLLGICVGMQLLLDVGEEMGAWPGLGLIGGRVVRFQFDPPPDAAGANLQPSTLNPQPSTFNPQPSTSNPQPSILNLQPSTFNLKVPHIGWNQIHPAGDHPLLRGVLPGSYAYFVHSYYPVVNDPAHVAATTDYGFNFASVIARDNVWGLQFHPEKSQDVGLQMLRNFVEA